MENLKGQKVVVLGGSAGIGFATAKAAANQGAEVVIVSSNQKKIDAALAELPAGGEGFAVDLTDEAQVSKLFTGIGKFDHLVYTAGEPLMLSNIEDTAVDSARQFFNLRYWGAFTAVKYAAPQINAGGSITLSGGSASSRPGKGWTVAASICSAMEGFTKAAALELSPLRVNMVAPGLVKTNLWDNMTEADRDGMYNHYSDLLPVKFVAGPDDIAQTYLYLMQQKYSTGQVVIVDGGLVLV
jgi:NAD(P)-dependent dehydrogenase (short-subunit alcohol dehydrogenase family)